MMTRQICFKHGHNRKTCPDKHTEKVMPIDSQPGSRGLNISGQSHNIIKLKKSQGELDIWVLTYLK